MLFITSNEPIQSIIPFCLIIFVVATWLCPPAALTVRVHVYHEYHLLQCLGTVLVYHYKHPGLKY